jgi:hypothetical protein
MAALPPEIFDFVGQNLNCEDIAMSFFVSAITDGKVPLLAYYWAVKSQVKLFHETSISSTSGHRNIRDTCVDTFADVLRIKDTKKKRKLRAETLFHDSDNNFHYGAIPDPTHATLPPGIGIPREEELKLTLMEWTKAGDPEGLFKQLVQMSKEAPQRGGLIEKTPEWQDRYWDTYGVNAKEVVVRIGKGTRWRRNDLDGSIYKIPKPTTALEVEP